MILDILKNGPKYNNVHPRFGKAFEFLLSNDLAAMPAGKIELEGQDLVINVVDAIGRTEDQARMETHCNYIDIQVPVGGIEKMGWKALVNLHTITSAYDSEKDVTFYADKATSMLAVQPMEFAIFFPEDGHQPQIAEGTFRKIIVKVRV